MLHDHCHDRATIDYLVVLITYQSGRCRQMVQVQAARPTTRVAKVHRELKNTVFEAPDTYAARDS